MKITFTAAISFLFGLGFLSQFVYLLYSPNNGSQEFINLNLKPYKERKANLYKVGLHLHSDEVFYTPERHSVKDIIASYKKYNYDYISISDYNQVTTPYKNEDYLMSYEWGKSLQKRHLLIVGIKEILSSGSFFYTSLNDIQLVIDEATKKGAFVTINHPDLFYAFSKEDLLSLKNYHAIEVFSPYGDKTEKWDYILTNKGQVYCLSSDDLHYFPESLILEFNQPFWKDILQHLMLQRGRESEAFLRYIVVRANEKTSKEIKNSLLTGEYFCIKKFNRNSKDVEIPEIIFQDNKIKVHYKNRFLKLTFTANNGKVIKEVTNNQNAEYILNPLDKYIRITVFSLEGILLSNPIFLN